MNKRRQHATHTVNFRALRARLLNGTVRFARRLVSGTILMGAPALAAAQTVLPAPQQPWTQKVGRSFAESGPPLWPAQQAAAKGAPNILLILTDDVGFGASSTFGGPIPTPTFDALAKAGLRYNQFNTTALCSPTRAALLTGRNPQNVGMGNVTNLPTGYEGYTSVIPKSAATVAEILRQNGYGTAMFGKSHLTPEWEQSQAGPFDRWPTGLGFEYFFGFLGADTNQFAPALIENTTPIEPPHDDPAYIFDRDMADHAIKWIDRQRSLAPDKPFFVYYAPGTAHTPHHAPKEWLAKFRGQFDQGWDKEREETFVRQKRLGVIPANAQLTPRPEGLPAWDTLNANQKRLYARLMEAYAASLAFADAQIGRVIESIRASGQLDNTMVVFIQGDNGGSAEGGLNGLMFEQSGITGTKEDFGWALKNIDKIGGPEVYNHYPAAWGWAMNAPFPWYKQVASHAGGTRNGLVISWPGGIKDAGGLRSQFHYVTDIMPTILQAAKVPVPTNVNGAPQKPLDGISMAYSFTAPAAPSQRHVQVFEMMENVGIYKDGWMAGTLPKRKAWEVGSVSDKKAEGLSVDRRPWTLYDLTKDFSENDDLAAAHPEKLAEMKALFWQEAAKSHILPVHDFTQGYEGRPSTIAGHDRFVYHAGLTRAYEKSVPSTIGRSYRIDADVVVPQGGAEGVLITQGGHFGGWGFYVDKGQLVFHYNALGPRQYQVRSVGRVPAGTHTLSADFRRDTPTARSGGTLTLAIDGKPVGSGRIDATLGGWISHNDGLDVGEDTLTPISDDYTIATSRFTGTLGQVVFTLK
ncbi:arylsulfatase [Sphingomonas profundi]|uniref:arylsulfatase n=1 Tax=Alterirhizorhabdus profundi TaxID=2681549 RepID=UPI001E2CCD1D|nr:arylsulfatase [Sphingomonas profundi]